MAAVPLGFLHMVTVNNAAVVIGLWFAPLGHKLPKLLVSEAASKMPNLSTDLSQNGCCIHHRDPSMCAVPLGFLHMDPRSNVAMVIGWWFAPLGHKLP